MSLIDERTGSFRSLVISDRGRFQLTHSGDIKIYDSLGVLPRAFIVHKAELVRDDTAALAVMQDASFDPSAKAVLNGNTSSCGVSDSVLVGGTDQDSQVDRLRSEGASITEYRPERVSIEANLSEPGVLLLTDAWYPGWQATVDGEPVTICRANLLFRAIALGPGQHRVVVTFRPLGHRVGCAVSSMGLLLLVIVGRYAFRRGI
jgi:hypothetical protein